MEDETWPEYTNKTKWRKDTEFEVGDIILLKDDCQWNQCQVNAYKPGWCTAG